MKNINLNELEILSPAGNSECFYANIHNGADAIYLGLSSFNARMNAENFTLANIREFVRYAHTFGVKVYITVNTLIENDDFEEFIKMIKVLTKAKVDAFIVQDFGVAHLLKNTFDNIVLHASTQMGIHNLNGAKIAEKLGFSRIVLSRETTLEDIKEIKNNTQLEIEYFVQGALCVAFSGNCYLSSLEKNASGNEGKCLQLCRLSYKNTLNNQTSYYLSARDLSLLENLNSLINAGVTSFKIEGRMRHAGYTATATKIYKTALEKIKTGTFSKDFLCKAEEALKITYSRGDFNKLAYLEKTIEEPVIFSDYQNHIGIKIGTVLKVQPFKNDLIKATLKLDREIFSGDGLKFINAKTKTQVASMGVGNVEKINPNIYIIYTKNKFEAGLDVHLTQSFKNEEKILRNKRKININIKIKAFERSPLEIEAFANDISVSFKSSYLLEKATKLPVLENDFKSQFEKLNETPFILQNFEFKTNNIFLPKSKINEARREIILLLENAIIKENEKHINAIFNASNFEKLNCTPIISKPTNIIVFRTLNEIKKIDESTIYAYSPDQYNFADILKTYQTFKTHFALSIPPILDYEDRHYLEAILNKLPEKVALYANNISAIYYGFSGHKIIASPLLNIKNNYAIKCLNALNIETIASSIEANENFVSNNNLIRFESGSFPLMTFAHCPYKSVTKTTCKACKFNDNLSYKNDNLGEYKIRRIKLKNCKFELLKPMNRKHSNFFVKNFNY